MALTNRILITFKYLWETTDESHPVSLADISAFLKQREITADPRTLRKDIEQLIEFGVDIVKDRRVQNLYHVATRHFEAPEVKLLIDAVQSARFITPRKSNALVNRLSSFVAPGDTALLKRHPAIISAMDFDMVQAEIARRQALGRSYSGSSIFASKLICGDCGGFYGKKVWHSTDAYRREIWRCNSKFKGESKCETPALDTETIQQMFLRAYNQLMGSREKVIQACEVMRSMVSDCTQLDTEIDALNEEIAVVAELVSQYIKENATTQQSQEEYNKKYNRLVKRYEKAVDRLNKATAERESRIQRDRDLRIFISSIKEQPFVLETWDEGLWLTLLETATVHADNRITFRFKDGTYIEVGAE